MARFAAALVVLLLWLCFGWRWIDPSDFGLGMVLWAMLTVALIFIAVVEAKSDRRP